jgi:hypothetical protein
MFRVSIKVFLQSAFDWASNSEKSDDIVTFLICQRYRF